MMDDAGMNRKGSQEKGASGLKGRVRKESDVQGDEDDRV